ncbi:MAG: hypothetical protein IPK07_34255 [Deltaproteobacteria bacterium]|jgi:hypothetical protein|nr:hypothetical protein [Deltaproteobacteria bacterium]
MDDGLIKLIVVAVFLFLSYVSKGLEKKARNQRQGGGGPATAPRRKTGLEALAELEKKLREAHRAAEQQARARSAPASAEPASPPTAARPKRPAPPTAEPEPEADPAHRTMTSGDELASRHLETHVSGLRSRHLQEGVESRHLDLDVAKAREGHAAILDPGAPTDVLTGAAAPLRRAAGARLPARLTELQRALIWSEILGPPVSLRENGRR